MNSIKYHLNWDGRQNNGIIYNDKYSGAFIVGEKYRPTLSFDYYYFQYSEVMPIMNHVIDRPDSKMRRMTADEAIEIKKIAINWIQAPGEEQSEEWLEKYNIVKKD